MDTKAVRRYQGPWSVDIKVFFDDTLKFFLSLYECKGAKDRTVAGHPTCHQGRYNPFRHISVNGSSVTTDRGTAPYFAHANGHHQRLPILRSKMGLASRPAPPPFCSVAPNQSLASARETSSRTREGASRS